MKRNEWIREIISTLGMVVLMVAAVLLIRWFVIEPFVVSGRSMEDTLHDGDRMVMLKRNEIERFDVVIMPAPEGDALYVKRVIGMPGDRIEYKDDKLILNGKALDEPYLEPRKSQVAGDFTFDFTLEDVAGQAEVPEGYVFVMGDNRQNSLDGRAFGFVKIDDLHGEADWIHWPLDRFGLLEKYELNEDGTQIVKRS
ncbi:signal peptidase I [Hutsoniella sourekii]|uniref:signal peptidase I n=1 Tax=Hutsoniella sourekii TaxID=87650 RepID=UPI000486F674|nr:signal peptidase I [Hutsoniella sourekii]